MYNLSISPGDIIKFTIITYLEDTKEIEFLVTSTELITYNIRKFLIIYGNTNMFNKSYRDTKLEINWRIDEPDYKYSYELKFDIALFSHDYSYHVDNKSIYVNGKYIPRDMLYEYITRLK